MHPDAAGVAYLTAQLAATIKNAFPSSPTHTGNPTPHRNLGPTLALALAVAVGAILLRRRKTRANAARR